MNFIEVSKNGNSAYFGDCLDVMDHLISKGIKVDSIITDIPYGTIQCAWDVIIPFEKMWPRLTQLISDNGAIVLFGSQPFTSSLIMSNLKMFKYEWIWEKNTGAGFIHAKNRPLKRHENILVFSKASMGHESLLGKNRMNYYPQGLIRKQTVRKNGASGETIGKRPSQRDNLVSEFCNYPTTILNYKSDKGLHPTQKPVALIETLIKTYTLPGQTVLDFTAGSFTTAKAAELSGRKWICIENEEKYFNLGLERVGLS